MKVFQRFRTSFLGASLLLGAATSSIAQTAVMIKDIAAEKSSSCQFDVKDYIKGTAPSIFVKMKDDRVFFFANDGISGMEPYITDGTAAGTKMIKDIVAGSEASIAGGSQAVFNPADNKVYFFAKNSSAGHKFVQNELKNNITRWIGFAIQFFCQSRFQRAQQHNIIEMLQSLFL